MEKHPSDEIVDELSELIAQQSKVPHLKCVYFVGTDGQLSSHWELINEIDNLSGMTLCLQQGSLATQ